VPLALDAELWLWDARRTQTWSQASCVLPVKRQVRVAEALDVDDRVAVTVELVDFG
jgi:hypothetical protein